MLYQQILLILVDTQQTHLTSKTITILPGTSYYSFSLAVQIQCVRHFMGNTSTYHKQERSAGLNFRGFHPMKLFMENFCSTLENCEKCESLAQRISTHLRYSIQMFVYTILIGGFMCLVKVQG